MPSIPHSRPDLGPDEIAAASAVIASGMLVNGEQVAAFEQELSAAVGVRGAVATSSGTAALHLALLALGVGLGDEVIIPTWVCTAVINAVRYVQATPIIVDVDPATGNIDPDCASRARNPRTRALIVPHMSGLPADLDPLLDLEVPLIEDCAQALGATYHGRPVGSFGAVSIFSFYATKVIATGEGGMLASSDRLLLERARDLAEYDNREKYWLSYNYKLTDFQAALGRRQLQRLPEFIAKRLALADDYRRDGARDWHGPISGHIHYRYLIRVRDVDRAVALLSVFGVDAKRPVYRPLHHYLAGTPCPAADTIHSSIISVPLYPALHAADAARVVLALRHLSSELLPIG